MKLSLPSAVRYTAGPMPRVLMPADSGPRVQPLPPITPPHDTGVKATESRIPHSRLGREDLIPGSAFTFVSGDPFDLSYLPSARPEGCFAVRKKGHGLGNDANAKLAIRDLEASPMAHFEVQEYHYSNLRTYLGISSFLKAEALRGRAYWGEAGWEDPKHGYRSRLAEFRSWLALREFPLSHTPALLKAVETGEQRWPGWGYRPGDAKLAYRAMGFAGELADPRAALGAEEITWIEVEGLALAMRLMSDEQASLLFPQLSLRHVRENLNRWVDQGFLKRYPALAKTGLELFQVTRQAVEQGIEDGTLTAGEGDSRLMIRSSQEVHDLAVGDAILLASVELLERQGEFLDLETETSFAQRGLRGPWPDFVIRFRVDGQDYHEAVEVVGVGGNYRSKGKLKTVKRGGIQVWNPGFDGKGARYV